MEAAEQIAAPPVRASMARWKKAVAGLGLATVSFVGFMGFLHTKPGRPLRAIIFGSCPVGNFDAQELEPQAAAAAAQLQGTGKAPSKAHLGFTLGSTTLADAEAWSKAKSVPCERKRDDSYFYCASVPASALGRPDGEGPGELNMMFRVEDKTLINLDYYHVQDRLEALVPLFERVASEWATTLGKPTHDTRAPGTPLAKAEVVSIDYRYQDAVFELSYMNLLGRRSVREHLIRPDLAPKSP